MEVVLNEENTIQQVFWQGNHKTSIKPGGGEDLEKSMLKAENTKIF